MSRSLAKRASEVERDGRGEINMASSFHDGFSGSSSVSWAAGLPPEVLALVFARLCVKKDRLAFLSTCRAWRFGCSACISSLSLPWPTLSTSSLRGIELSDSSCGAQTRGKILEGRGSDTGASGSVGASLRLRREGSRTLKRSSSCRNPVVKSSSSLSVRFLASALKLFSNLTVLELTVPLPPDSLGAIATLSSLRHLHLCLRPFAFSPATSSSLTVATTGTAAPPRDDKYESYFLAFLSSCTNLSELAMSMRACRWEYWPLLSGSLLGELSSRLPLLEVLHVRSPMFSTHDISALLSLSRLRELTLPLDLPHPHPPCGSTTEDRMPHHLPCLEELELQPYSQVHREGHGISWRGADFSWMGEPGSGMARRVTLSSELPHALALFQSMRSLCIRGYGRSSLQRAEFMSNPLSGMPDLSPLQRLSRLELWSLRELEEIPANVCMLPSLATLIIQDCPVLLELPEELGSLKRSLREMSLHSIGLHSLPSSFCDLVHLETLCLSHLYWLELLPEALGDLSSLSSLVIASCKRVSPLPDSFSCLTSLSTLALSFNAFPLGPTHLSELVQLTSLTLSLRCPQDLATAPALASLGNLEVLHLTMADDGAGMSISGADIAALLPCSPRLTQLTVEDLRFTSYAASAADLYLGGRGVQDGANDGRAHDGQPDAHDPLQHFTHSVYPMLSGLKHLRLKCAWLEFSHERFPQLEAFDLVLLSRGKVNADPTNGVVVQENDAASITALLKEVFLCQHLRSFVLFTPEAPDVLSAPRGRGSSQSLMTTLLPNDTAVIPQALHTFLMNNMDMLPYL